MDLNHRVICGGRNNHKAIFSIVLLVKPGHIEYTFTRQIDKKTSELVMSMDSMQIQHKPSGQPANLTMLESSVNALVNRTVELMDEVYREKLNAKDMELKLLQAQINPHFLYNIIDTIYWMAMRRNAADIADMLSALAKYFRFSLNKGRDIVPIEDEIELAHAYIRLQRARFPGRFLINRQILCDTQAHPPATD